MFSQKKIEAQLADYYLPYCTQSLVKSGCLRSIAAEGRQLTIQLRVGFPVTESVSQFIQQAIAQRLPEFDVQVLIDVQIAAHQCQPHVPLLSGVKNVIAISSGKGGVGKSTTAVNIALALQQAGARVGLLDADIYGPNQPHMLGINAEPEVINDRLMVPIERYGMQTLSFGNLIAVETPAIWRGPMVTKALQQLFFQSRWQNLDYLIVDMPPGTGDIQLTLSKKIPVSGVVVVTTPQDIALIDARKGLEMFHKVDVSLLGIVENMSQFECPHCHEKTALFGHAGGEQLSEATGVPVLGHVPLAMAIREAVDTGKPTVIAEPYSFLTQAYNDIALAIAARLSWMPKVPVLGKTEEE
jgi:ATP-binding protein involved in chromosome partitioning